MNLIERYDGWVRQQAKAVLDWLNEWLSISQKAIERTLIGFYAVGSCFFVVASKVDKGTPAWIIVLIQSAMIMMLWGYHKEPVSVRTIKHGSSQHMIMRVIWQFLVICVSLPPYKNSIMDISLPLTDLTLVSFLYVVASNSGGERGRKRKLAWDKLKELFSWLPDPVPEGM